MILNVVFQGRGERDQDRPLSGLQAEQTRQWSNQQTKAGGPRSELSRKESPAEKTPPRAVEGLLPILGFQRDIGPACKLVTATQSEYGYKNKYMTHKGYWRCHPSCTP